MPVPSDPLPQNAKDRLRADVEPDIEEGTRSPLQTGIEVNPIDIGRTIRFTQ